MYIMTSGGKSVHTGVSGVPMPVLVLELSYLGEFNSGSLQN